MEIETRCPSGMVGVIRPLKVSDEKVLIDNKLLRTGNIVLELCKRAWVRLIDPGPYEFNDNNIEWNKILQGDAYWLFFQVRKISYGPIYEFTYKCDQCNTLVRHELNIDTDLDVNELSDESKAIFKNGQYFEVQSPDNKLVQFRLLTAGDETKVNRLVESREMTPRQASAALSMISVEGLEAKDSRDFARYIESMTPGDFDILCERMEEYECGVDTDIIVMCSNKSCGVEDVILLPLQISFFQSRKMKSLDRVKQRKAKLKGKARRQEL